METAKTIEEEWDNWDDFDEVKKPIVDIIFEPRQTTTTGKQLQSVQEKVNYGDLYLVIADSLKRGWTFKKISREVMDFMERNGLTLHNNDDVSESRIADIIHGVRDCMRARKGYYESNYYPCHKKHYDFGVWLYKEFKSNDVFHAEVKDAFTTI